MSKSNNLVRVAFSPAEFAALFGKEQTWGYRQLYGGKVNATTEYGRIMIPASEVERILATAGTYDGIKSKIKSKADFQKQVPKLRSTWQRYLSELREAGKISTPASSAAMAVKAAGRLPWNGNFRRAIARRLGGQTKHAISDTDS